MMEEETTDKKPVVQFLTVEGIAERLKFSPKTIRSKWRLLGGFKVLGSIRFDWEITHKLILEANQANQWDTPTALLRGMQKVDRRRRRKSVYELTPDRHGILDPKIKALLDARRNLKTKGGETD